MNPNLKENFFWTGERGGGGVGGRRKARVSEFFSQRIQALFRGRRIGG